MHSTSALFASTRGEIEVSSPIHVAFWRRHLGVSEPVLWMSIAEVGFDPEALEHHVARLHGATRRVDGIEFPDAP